MDCQTCGMHVDPPNAYHPYIFCELYRLGHHDPAQYLRDALPGAVLDLPRLVGTSRGERMRR